MRARNLTGRLTAALVFLTLCLTPAVAVDVEKKFRVSLSAGFFNSQDEISSDSGNELSLLDPVDMSFVDFFSDPRNDSGVFGNLDLQSGTITTVRAQYAVTPIFIVEASVGYQKADFGDVEMQVQFDGVNVPELEAFNFTIYRIPAGEVERVPIQLTALARFRPRSNFNPYVGAGVGYTIIGFDPTDELNELSLNMDRSEGGMMSLTSAFFGAPALLPPSQVTDLEGAYVDARDTFEWHLAGGAEYSFGPKWAMFLDVRWTFSSRKLEIGFNGAQGLGVSVPEFTDFKGSATDQTVYGAVRITQGGLLDGGMLIPDININPSADCDTDPLECEFSVGMLDGELDTGIYYVQGGAIETGGVGVEIGARFSF